MLDDLRFFLLRKSTVAFLTIEDWVKVHIFVSCCLSLSLTHERVFEHGSLDDELVIALSFGINLWVSSCYKLDPKRRSLLEFQGNHF